MIAENFQIYGVKITGKYIRESKIWICSFLHTNPPLDSYHYPLGRANLLIAP